MKHVKSSVLAIAALSFTLACQSPKEEGSGNENTTVESSEKHEGLVTAVVFESIVKLIAFLAVGVFIEPSLAN